MANQQEVLLPDIGDFDKVEIIEIAVAVGDVVDVEDTLITLESDKATMEIPSPAAGTVKSLNVAVGDMISEGSPIIVLNTPDNKEDASTETSDYISVQQPIKQEEEKGSTQHTVTSSESGHSDNSGTSPSSSSISEGAQRPAPNTPDGAQLVGESGSAKAHASPSIRRFARELGVDLGLVRGSGRKGRITKEDVKAFTKAVMSDNRVFEKDKGGFSLPEIPPVDFSRFGPVETVALSRLKRLSGQNLHRSWVTVPHVTQFDEADITDLEEFRKSKKDEAEKTGTRLTLLSFLIKAVVVALKKFPEFNASLSPEGENLIRKNYYHIGIAVNTDSGLMVPVVRDADKKGMFHLAKELANLAQKARDKKLSPAEIQGGCFTISSLGHIGGTGFTPIVNAPEVAIMGVSQGTIKPVYVNGQLEPRLILPFSLSYDHRVIDGVAAAEFTRELAHILTDIRDILL
ncbi:MAG: dihydrolipoyllysine-residue acetyltransferase [Pirellulales bacterium]|nr:dihydrolipoyllysine-residue acetyltransferase [Pirellulales bacterium]